MSASLRETPLRPDGNRTVSLAGDHVVVTQAWFAANEEQRSHLLRCVLDQGQRIADLERRLADQDEVIARLRHTA